MNIFLNLMRKFYIIIMLVFFTSFYSKELLSQIKEKENLFRFKYVYSEALKNKAQENYSVSINYLEECLKLLPSSSASAYQLSIIYLKLGEFEEAKQFINYALQYDSKNEWYIYQKALVASALGDKILYKECYISLNTFFPENPTYAYELSILFFKDAQYKLSIKLLNKIENELGVIENISFLKNNIFFKTKEYDLIRKELLKLSAVYVDSAKYVDMLGEYFLSMQHINKALSTYQNGLIKFPDNKLLKIKLAKIFSSIKDFQHGFNYFINGIGAKNLSIEEQFIIAEFYLASDDIKKEEKIKIYLKFLDLDIGVHQIEADFIRYLLKEKELSLAETQILKILDENSENFDLWNSLFSIYISQNRIEELNSASEKAKSYFPNQAIVYFYSGYSYFILKDHKRATNSLLTGLDYVIENEALEKDFYLYLGESFHAQNLHKKSDYYFDKYLSVDSTNAYLLNNYAYYLAQRNSEIDKSFKLSRKSIEMEPFNSSFLDTYAWILYLQKKYSNALFNIEKAYKFGGKNNPVICEHFGDILLKNDMKKEAIDKWKESLKLNPQNNLLLNKIKTTN